MQKRQSAVALGYFDGVHLGHRRVLKAAVQTARAHGLVPAAFTFTLPNGGAGKGAALLTPDEKLRRLYSCGIERIETPPFEEFCTLTPQAFVREILVRRLSAAYVFTGEDFTFGANKAGDTQLLAALCAEHGICAQAVPTRLLGDIPVSSTRIRSALTEGDLLGVQAMLGEPYVVTTPIVHGKKLGRALGYPTLNQQYAPGMLVPRCGVYASAVYLNGKWYAGATGLGTRPTVDDSGRITCETFLPDFSGDAYEERVRVYLLKYLWPTQQFDNMMQLKEMIGRAAQCAKEEFALFLELGQMPELI